MRFDRVEIALINDSIIEGDFVSGQKAKNHWKLVFRDWVGWGKFRILRVGIFGVGVVKFDAPAEKYRQVLVNFLSLDLNRARKGDVFTGA